MATNGIFLSSNQYLPSFPTNNFPFHPVPSHESESELTSSRSTISLCKRCSTMESSCITSAEPESCFNSEPRKLRAGPVLSISPSCSPGSENAAQTSNEHEHAQQLHGLSVLQS